MVDTCLVTGTLTDAGGVGLAGQTISIKPNNIMTSGPGAILPDEVFVVTGAGGSFSGSFVPGLYRMTWWHEYREYWTAFIVPDMETATLRQVVDGANGIHSVPLPGPKGDKGDQGVPGQVGPGALNPTNSGYTSRAGLVAAVAAGDLDDVPDGMVVLAAGLQYIKKDGSTVIPDLNDWEPSGPLVYPEQFSGTLSDQWEKAAFAANALGLRMKLEGEHILPRGVVIPHSIVFDCAPDFVARNGYAGAVGTAMIQIGYYPTTQIPDMSTDLAEGGRVITFATAHGLSDGTWCIIANPTDFSYSGFRSYYRAGEFFKVQKVLSSTSVLAEHGAYAGYDKDDVDVFVMDKIRVGIVGKFRIETDFTSPQGSVIDFIGVTDSDITGLDVTFDGLCHSGIVLRKCAGLTGYGVRSHQRLHSDAGATSDYALQFGNSQQIKLDSGTFFSRRHGVAGGNGGGGHPNPVCRDVHIDGFIGNDILADSAVPGLTAADHHGNCERCSYSGVIWGGLSPGGNMNKYGGTVYSNGAGFLVLSSETVGTDFDFRGTKFIATSPMHPGSTEFIVPVTMDANDINANTVHGGLIDFSDTRWDMALGGGASYIAHFDPRARAASAADLSLSFKNAVIERSNPDLLGVYQCRASAGSNTFEMVDSRGLECLDNASLPVGTTPGTTPRILRDSQSGSFDVILNTAVTQMDVIVPFNKPFNPFPADIQLSTKLPSAYSTPIVVNVRDVTNANQFQVRINAIGGNFAAGTLKLMWQAS